MPKIKANGINLYYEIVGKGDPLLLIHGLGSSTRDWEQQTKVFSQSYQVISFDLRGHGQSDKPSTTYSISLFAEDSAALLKALNIKKAHIVGISLGGFVAFQLAIDFPQLIKTLTIVNSTPDMVVRTFKDRLKVWQRFVIVRLLGMRKMGEVLSKRLFPNEEHAALRTTFIERWAENDPQAYQAALGAIVGWSVKDQLASITCPTLIISAEYDYTPFAVKEAYTRLLANAQLVVIPNAHHATPLEKPDEFNSVLMTFITQHGYAIK